MTGVHKGVIKYCRDKHSDIYMAGCTLHLVHISAKKASEVLVPIDDILIGIYYYFSKSDCRKTAFQGDQKLFDVEQKKKLKHVCTRWLSIGRCVERLLHNWDPLKLYFRKQKDKIDAIRDKRNASEKKQSKLTSYSGSKSTSMTTSTTLIDKSDISNQNNKTTSTGDKTGTPSQNNKTKSTGDKTGTPNQSSKSKLTVEESVQSEYTPGYAEKKVEAIYGFIKFPTNKLYTLFLNYTIHVFDDILLNLQTEKPMIHVLRRSLLKLLRNIISRFVKPSALTSSSTEEVDYKISYNQKVDSELVIGEAARY